MLVTDLVTSAKFVQAMECLSQQLINKEEKSGIIRAMQTSPTMTEDISKKLKGELGEKELKTLLGWLQAAQSNSFCGVVIQRLADSFAAVDLRSLLTMDQLEELVIAVSAYPEAFALEATARKDLDALCGPAIAKDLRAVTDDHLRDCFALLRRLTDSSFSQALWEQTKIPPNLAKYKDRFHPLVVQRLVFATTCMTEADKPHVENCKHVAELLDIIGDPVVSVALTGMCQDVSDAELTLGLVDLLRELDDGTNDSLIVRMWHRFMTIADPEMLPLHRAILRAYTGGSRGSKNPDVFRNIVKATLAEVDSVQTIDRLSEFIHIPKKELQSGELHKECIALSIGKRLEAVRKTLYEAKVFFDLELSYSIFEEICRGCHDFDLRDIVVDSVDRRVLPIALHSLWIRKDHLFFQSTVALEELEGDVSVEPSLGLNLSKQQVLTYLVEAMDSPELEMSTVDGIHSAPYFFSNLSEVVRLCLNDQMSKLFAVAGEVFRSDAGQLFHEQCIAHIYQAATSRLASVVAATSSSVAFEAEANPEAVVMIIASNLMQFIRPKNDEIIKALRRIYTKFEPREVQRDALLRLVPDEQIVCDAVSLNAEEKKLLHLSMDVHYRMVNRVATRHETKSAAAIKSFVTGSSRQNGAAGGGGHMIAGAQEAPEYDDDDDDDDQRTQTEDSKKAGGRSPPAGPGEAQAPPTYENGDSDPDTDE
jgi:hypothetical protein